LCWHPWAGHTQPTDPTPGSSPSEAQLTEHLLCLFDILSVELRAAIHNNLTGQKRRRNAAKGGARCQKERKPDQDMRVEKHETRETHKRESEIEGEN